MSLTVPPTASSVLALVTTVHLALASLRNHRQAGPSPVSLLAVVSALFAATPWTFPSPAGLAAGLALHGAWFAVCERFVRRTGPAELQPPAPTALATTPAPVLVPRPRGFIDTRVLAVIDETPDIRTFRLKRPDGFDFVAGQFLAVRVQVDGRDHARCYSISSAPDTRGSLEISVKRVGLVSSALHATLRPGSSLPVKAPAGQFTYPADDDRPLLLLAGGIGITPLLSMVRHAVSVEPSRRITLLYSARREEDLAFRDELQVLDRRHPQLRLVFACTRDATSAGIYPGRIDESLIRATTPDVAEAVVLICGPAPMIDGSRALLAGLGVPAARIRAEVFEAAIAASGGRMAGDAVDDGQPHAMRCARSGATIAIQPGQTLLEAAEAGGVDIDSLCRSGVCGTCRMRVIDGDVHCESLTLDAADREEGYVLACVTHARGDCTVEV